MAFKLNPFKLGIHKQSPINKIKIYFEIITNDKILNYLFMDSSFLLLCKNLWSVKSENFTKLHNNC